MHEISVLYQESHAKVNISLHFIQNKTQVKTGNAHDVAKYLEGRISGKTLISQERKPADSPEIREKTECTGRVCSSSKPGVTRRWVEMEEKSTFPTQNLVKQKLNISGGQAQETTQLPPSSPRCVAEWWGTLLASLTFASTSSLQTILHPLSESLLNLNQLPPYSLPPPPVLSPRKRMCCPLLAYPGLLCSQLLWSCLLFQGKGKGGSMLGSLWPTQREALSYHWTNNSSGQGLSPSQSRTGSSPPLN